MPGTPKWQKSSLEVVPKIRFTLSERFHPGTEVIGTGCFCRVLATGWGSPVCKAPPEFTNFGTAS